MGCCGSTAAVDYKTPQELRAALAKCGVLEDLEIVIGIDATESNESQGSKIFGGRSLHDLTEKMVENPYLGVMKSATKFLERDKNGVFPLYFFGSRQARATDGVLFAKDCKGSADLVATYKQVIQTQTLSGPTTFVPLIKEALKRVKASKKYHILLIITDGEVAHEKEHFECLDEASRYPLSIVCFGVGDGPWDAMEKFDDSIPAGRIFDNFQFVPYNTIVAKENKAGMEEEFFFRGFMEVPTQYQEIKDKLKYTPPVGGAAIPPAHLEAKQPNML
jgi:E3 ubiquitin-protein ligase RGLG